MAAVFLVLGTGDIGGEDTVNWFFGRTFHDEGLFNVPSRAPILQPYLSALGLLPYPWSAVVEKFLRAALCFGATYFVLRRFSTFPIAIFTAIVWLPALVKTAPAAQAYALAAAFAALGLRAAAHGNVAARIGWSYALLACAWLLRSNYALLFFAVGAFDIIRWGVSRRWALPAPRTALLLVTPTFIFVLFTAWSASHQSPNRWNNVFSVTTAWLPYPTQTTGPGHISQAMSYSYVEQHGASLDVPFDSYFMHRKLFGDMTTVPGMIQTDPLRFGRFVARNVRGFFTTAASLTTIGNAIYPFTTFGTRVTYRDQPSESGAVDHRYVTVILSIGLIGALLAAFHVLKRDERGRIAVVFIIGLGAIAASALLVSGSKDRFLHPYLGAMAIVGAAVGQRLSERRSLLPRRFRPLELSLAGRLAASAIVLLALAPPGWAAVGRDMAAAYQRFKEAPSALSLFYGGRNLSLFDVLDAHRAKCRGIMALEAKEIATFTRFPRERVFDIYEIPPFGRLGDPSYDGLRADRVNCVFVSSHLSTLAALPVARQAVTNQTIRFQNYIGPYIERLRAAGAQSIRTDAGEIIMLSTDGDAGRKREQR